MAWEDPQWRQPPVHPHSQAHGRMPLCPQLPERLRSVPVIRLRVKVPAPPLPAMGHQELDENTGPAGTPRGQSPLTGPFSS